MRIGAIALIGLFVFILVFNSCNGEKTENGEINEPPVSYVSDFQSPDNGGTYVQGDKIPFKIVFSDGGKSVVRVDISLDGNPLYIDKGGKKETTFELPTDTLGLCWHKLKSETTLKDSMVETIEIEIMLVAKNAPHEYGYRVINKFPHDVNAYTQGLVFENGMMYEGTGQNGRSEIRYVDFKNNKIERSQKLDNTVFGEGVAIVGNKAYQLSWQNRKGFVYDKNTFKLIKEFNYTTEGWGLCYDGSHLILSDGTSTLYFYDPETFSLSRKLQVADNSSCVSLLNELEYISGEIWANVYQSDNIVRIDPKTGEVKGRINLEGLLTPEEKMNGADVLNGIAYDAATNKIYVTGKLWPWIFEVELEKKNPEISRLAD